MSAPPRVIYIDKFSVVDCLKDIGGDWEYILKSDYDELQAKLTESQRLNAVALKAMKSSVSSGFNLSELIRAIKELEALK